MLVIKIAEHLSDHNLIRYTKGHNSPEETYTKLKKAKLEGESFSDVIDRLFKKTKENLSAYFGALREQELLNGLEEDSRRIRRLLRLRNDRT